MTRVLNVIVLLGTALPASAQDPVFDEYQVKAAFLYNFTHFVEWPPGTFASYDDPIAICIAGPNPSSSALEEIVRGKKVGDRTIVVRRLANTHEAAQCQILFMGGTEWKRAPTVLGDLRGAGILTVGETSDFTTAGGIIAFKRDGGRIRLQVAVEVAEHRGLRISSKLLRLAEVVRTLP